MLNLYPRPKNFEKVRVKKVLIIRLDRIGDLILSSPLFRAVGENLPEAEISILINSYTKDIIIHNYWIDEILAFGELSAFDILKEVRKRKFDLVLVLHDTFLGNMAALVSGASYIIGYDSNYSNFIMTHHIKDGVYINTRSYVETNLDFARFLNFEINSKDIEISITERGEDSAEKFFCKYSLQNNQFVVCIHPGSWMPYIRWKKEGFAQVSDRLIREKNAKVILIGNHKERKLIQEIVSFMEERPIVAIGLEPTELISLIKRCSLFIGNSTGPMHIAAGLNIPVVAIFGNIHPHDSYKRWGPWGRGHIVVSKDLNCKKCHPGDCKTFDCMKLITVEDVLCAVDKQLERMRSYVEVK